MKLSRVVMISSLLCMTISCRISKPETSTGSLLITVSGGSGVDSILKMTDVGRASCRITVGDSTIVNLEENLYMQNDVFEIMIDDLEPADDYSAWIYRKNSNGENVCRADTSHIEVRAGEVSEITLTWESFIPVLNSPANNSILTDRTPIFNWNEVNAASAYDLEMDNSSSFTTPLMTLVNRVATSVSMLSAMPNDTYYWRVRARDNQGEASDWSDTWSMTIDSQSDIHLEWVTVPGGTFQMGSLNGESNEGPIHTVTISTFQISTYETTNGQFCEFLNDLGVSSDGSYHGTEYIDMDDPDCQIAYSGGEFSVHSGKELFPVREITWYGARAFCIWAGGRLPTEAEWEYAAQGGNQGNGYIYSGSNTIDEVAWYGDNSGGDTHQVGTKQPNELGIYDMTGNVWEHCNDWYAEDYYSSSPQFDPQGPANGRYRVFRGGCFGHIAYYERLTYRSGNPMYYSMIFIGMRVARDEE